MTIETRVAARFLRAAYDPWQEAVLQMRRAKEALKGLDSAVQKKDADTALSVLAVLAHDLGVVAEAITQEPGPRDKAWEFATAVRSLRRKVPVGKPAAKS